MLLLRAASFAAVMVPPSLSSVRSSSGRTFVQEAMGIFIWRSASGAGIPPCELYFNVDILLKSCVL